MKQTIHMCMSVRGMLNWPKPEFKRACKWVTHVDGTPFTPDELREMLYDELSKGHEVLPIGECDDFDWKTGCNGHPCEES